MVKQRPAVILDSQKVKNLVIMNEKALSKTTESSIVWMVLDNERVLPLEPEVKVKTIRITDHWIEIRTDDTEGTVASADNPKEKLILGESGFLDHLTEVIRERRISMPEGSYTTHLFSKGIDKIRKKTGEEAIELVLAREKKDIICESADLVYHMMVLLEAEGLNIGQVITELQRRESL